MEINYTPKGVCASKITIKVEDGIVTEVKFTGGCSGNAAGISSLVKGMPVDEVIKRLDGIKCGFKSTSCPAQLAEALKKSLQ
ncbi:MAG: TIGR03905 family TSCPD domain-containing protein [Oscillospiraceae bacterium]|jgi:uncharacterized protein (TIGR03905 family)|nr:hypothetical protein [Oscillospiraceae bacterium]MCX7657797.1 TIGR03905 family TSCPD domain-containing protein [Oscillospiraceae bacterium]MDN5378754.1 hypothetical protein [Clostridiales bacterium]HOV40954.1 TIGR03905 family TSCPD domain-containing protein [Oscillospiraceae bacterium]